MAYAKRDDHSPLRARRRSRRLVDNDLGFGTVTTVKTHAKPLLALTLAHPPYRHRGHAAPTRTRQDITVPSSHCRGVTLQPQYRHSPAVAIPNTAHKTPRMPTRCHTTTPTATLTPLLPFHAQAPPWRHPQRKTPPRRPNTAPKPRRDPGCDQHCDSLTATLRHHARPPHPSPPVVAPSPSQRRKPRHATSYGSPTTPHSNPGPATATLSPPPRPCLAYSSSSSQCIY
ncbi:hypothetical protein EDB89DRAFT_1907322 [Lactarius sanguifluus]|nr:hypothetical protein EDB89DRAFT_1907322 [Lactarius sanguifluus]